MRAKLILGQERGSRARLLRQIFQRSLQMTAPLSVNIPRVANPCKRIREASDLGSLLRAPGLGHQLNLHAMECASCRALVSPYWDSAMSELNPSQLEGIRRLRTALRKAPVSSPSMATETHNRAIDRVRKLVDDERVALGASSCTVYLVDPIWKNEFRLLACPGVKLPETMQGFVMPEPVVTDVSNAVFCADARSESQRRNRTFVIPETIPDGVRYLFGDFVEREGVASSARLDWRRGGTVEVILFVNFNTRVSFDGRVRSRTRRLLDEILLYRDEISLELQVRDAPTVREMLNIMKAAQGLADVGLDRRQSLNGYFESVLSAAMEATGVSSETGVGTIHLYDAETRLLSLVAYRGRAKHIERARFQYANQGMGVISWVALRGRPLIIRDLQRSPFKAIHIPLMDKTKGELAVPMMAGGRLLGVLNLETTKGHFRNRHVRPLEYAANVTAGAVRLFQAVDKHEQLMHLVQRLQDCFLHATSSTKEVRADLAALGDEVSQWLGADGWDMWHYQSESDTPFCEALVTYSDFNHEKFPRQRGWSHYICNANQCIWISNIKSAHKYDLFFWNRVNEVWRKNDSVLEAAPIQLNDPVIRRGVASELGIPIFVQNRCVGVVWAEYKKSGPQPPSKEQMSMALGFAAGAGLIMHFAKVQLAEDKTELEATLPQLCARDLMALTAGLCSRHEVSPRSLVPTCPGEARLATGFATGD